MEDKISIIHKDGVLTLISNEIDFKIDTNRKIYIKRHDEPVFKYIGKDINAGMKKHEKENFIINLRSMVMDELVKKEPEKYKIPVEEEEIVEESEEEKPDEDDIKEKDNIYK